VLRVARPIRSALLSAGRGPAEERKEEGGEGGGGGERVQVLVVLGNIRSFDAILRNGKILLVFSRYGDLWML
jgi:hypothetical protein